MGGHASGFKNIHDHDTYDVDGTRMFQVRGTCKTDVRAVQVPEVAKSLNSDDVFVLETPKATYLWLGKGASDEEKEYGKHIIPLVAPGRDVIELQEEAEPDAFWASIGGKGDYDRSFQSSEAPLLPTRLFHCSDAAGKFKIEEISDFTQEDLDTDDVMILDTGDEVYVWMGSGATPDEKKKSLKLAEDYIRGDPTERNLDNTVIIKLHQGEEPPAFTSVFSKWDTDLWQKNQTIDSYKQDAKQKNAAI